jgi:hypothetical protein
VDLADHLQVVPRARHDPADSKKVTIIAPSVMTPEEAYGVFLNALDSVGLTVEPSDWFLRIIETSTAKSHAIPFDPGHHDEQPTVRSSGNDARAASA